MHNTIGGLPPQPLPQRDYFDAVNLRLPDLLPPRRLKEIQTHAAGVADQRPGRYLPELPILLSVKQPRPRGLELLAGLDGGLVNYIEPARDLLLGNVDAAEDLHDRFNQHFLQPWHGQHETCFRAHGTTSYTKEPGSRGLRFVWYADQPCRWTNREGCFHLEGRHVGADSVRRAGITTPRDLLDFDFDRYWSRHLQLYRLDFDQLGRFNNNRVRGSRRRKANIDRCGNWDAYEGGILFRVLGRDAPDQDAELQRFVDHYGRGPYLQPLEWLELVAEATNSTDIIMINMQQPFLSL